MKIAIEDIQQVLRDHPLTSNGYALPDTYYGGEPKPEISTPRLDGSGFDLEQVQRVMDYMEKSYPIARKPKVGSYGLKHLIERNTNEYVLNGTTILAAILLGYPVVRDGTTPNALIGALVKVKTN